MSILGLIFPIGMLAIIAVIVMILMAARGEFTTGIDGEVSSKGGEEMIKTLYVYLVLFATLMMSIGGSVSAFMAVADLVAPQPYYESYEDYKRYITNDQYDYRDQDSKEKIVIPDEAQIKADYADKIDREAKREVSRAKNTLIKSFGWILIPLGIFVFYQCQLVGSKA